MAVVGAADVFRVPVVLVLTLCLPRLVYGP